MIKRPDTPATLAEEWGCSERMIRNLIASGELRAFRLGQKLVRIPADAAEEYIHRRSTALPKAEQEKAMPCLENEECDRSNVARRERRPGD